MKLTFLGTGTSVGVPTVGCDCETCLSDDPRDKRLRTSVLLEQGEHNFIIDASTDFRQQALRTGMKKLDAILFTHAHADHCFGLDDTRPLMFRHGAIPCFASGITWEGLRRIYSYVFEPAPYPGLPRVVPHRIEGPFNLFGLEVEALSVTHGRLPVTAYRIGRFAYVTDCNLIPDETCDRLKGLDLLVIDALRLKEHPTHMSLDQSLGYIRRLKPERALLTHISHDIKHAETGACLPEGVEIAYDGLEVEVNR
ncbi:MAG TPA: MBL fold metallo-hydrolase [Blastocatellia bacterium]|jgi:phosphoribosyl 1,2-cyclic phosphate phosphodiesterase|nr:MBL fold metallo-hydrolase [Blastocatellia bacterium]